MVNRFRFIFLILLFTGCNSQIEVDLTSVGVESSAPLIYAESKSDGTGSLITNSQIYTRTADVDIFAIERDDLGNFVENSIVQWSLEGNAGTLTVQGGGRSASFNPVSSGSAKITYTVSGVSKSVTLDVQYNEVPVFNFLTPSAGSNTTVQNSFYNLQWTDSDSDDDASINLYYSTNSSGVCESNNLLTSNVSENNATDSFNWDTNGIAAGTYYLCATIEDQVSKEQVWNPQVFTITNNVAPTLSFNVPAAGTNIISNNDGVFLNWNDADPDDNASIEFYIVTSTSVACNTGTPILSTNEDSATDSFNYDTTSMASGIYYFCADIDDGFNSLVKVISPAVIISRSCNWLGITNDFHSSTNWSNCNSLIPQGTDRILLTATANDPVISSDVSNYGVAAGGTNVDVTINSSATLSLNSENKFNSSVTFKGNSVTCGDCEISLNGNDSFVLNNSTLRLESGITVYSSTSTIDLGDGNTAGHLVLVGGVPDNERVRILSSGPWGFRGIVLNGTGLGKSSINANNVIMNLYHGYSSGSTKGLHFKNHYEILALDNIKFTKSFLISQSEAILFENCSNGVFTDRDFSNFVFQNHFSNSSHNIEMNASTCITLPGATPITMTNATGLGYGTVFESDPNNLVTWYTESANLCEWNGTIDDVWTNSANWTNCANGRNGYPDQFDEAYIPTGTPNDPVISSRVAISKINTPGGPGGGKITINAGNRLWISGQEILSDVVITGAPDNCTSCGFGSESTSILSGAQLTIERGLDLYSNSSATLFKVGNGVSNGHLIINPNSADQSFWPTVTPTYYYNGGITVEGSGAGNKSSLTINGLNSPMHHSRGVVDFIDYYEVIGLDNIITKSAFGWDMAYPRFKFNNCANSIFTDTNWDNIDFFSPAETPMGTGYNMSFTSCGAMTPGTINVTPLSGGSNAGFGAAASNDPLGILNWIP